MLAESCLPEQWDFGFNFCPNVISPDYGVATSSIPQGKEECCREPYNWKLQVFWHFIKSKSQDLFQADIWKAFPDHTGEQCTCPLIEGAGVKSMVQVFVDVV